MKFDQLLYFLETAKHEHIGKASKILHIGPSAIRHSISALEDELGCKLFIKRGKRIFLTNHGKLMAERAVGILDQVSHLKNEMTSETVEQQGHYKFAATHRILEKYLTPAWIDLTKDHPKVTAELYTYRSSEVLKQIIDGQLDLGICFCPQNTPQFQEEVLYRGQLVLVVRKNHPFLKKKNRKVSDLSDYPATLPKSYSGIENCETHPMLTKHGIIPQSSLLYDSYTVATLAIQQSDAWGFMPDLMAQEEQATLVTIEVEDWEAPVKLSAIWPKNRILTKVLKEMIRVTRDKIKQVMQS